MRLSVDTRRVPAACPMAREVTANRVSGGYVLVVGACDSPGQPHALVDLLKPHALVDLLSDRPDTRERFGPPVACPWCLLRGTTEGWRAS